MAFFKYKARNSTGKLIEDVLEADNQGAAAQKLQQQGLIILDLRAGKTTKAKDEKKQVFSLFKKRLKLKEIAVFCKQLSFMLEAGVPLFSGLQIIGENQAVPEIKKLVDGLMHELKGGKSFGDSCREFNEIPTLMADMISAGEVGGFLDSSLSRLADYFEKEIKTAEKVKTAMIYPIMIISISLIAISVVLLFVIPVFGGILESMNVPIPTGTKIILGFSLFFRKYWYIVISLVFGLGAFLVTYIRSPKGKRQMDDLSLKAPVIKDLAKKVIVARFCRTLANLLQSGVPIIQSLDVVGRTLNNEKLKSELAVAQKEVTDGNSLTRSFRNTVIFPPMVIQMMAVGEQSGNLDELLEKVSDYYDDEVEEATERLPKMIEPIMLLFMGLMVGGIVVGVLIPMFSVMSNIG